MFVYYMFITSLPSLTVGPQSEDLVQISKCVSFDDTAFDVGGKEGWVPVNWFNHTNGMAVATPTDRP